MQKSHLSYMLQPPQHIPDLSGRTLRDSALQLWIYQSNKTTWHWNAQAPGVKELTRVAKTS